MTPQKHMRPRGVAAYITCDYNLLCRRLNLSGMVCMRHFRCPHSDSMQNDDNRASVNSKPLTNPSRVKDP